MCMGFTNKNYKKLNKIYDKKIQAIFNFKIILKFNFN
jgi:hypothetical protein